MSESQSNNEAFLSEISESDIEDRLKRHSIYLVEEHKSILEYTVTKTVHLLTMKKKSKIEPEFYDEFHQSIIMFNNSVENLLNTYFLLFMEREFLLLQSEQDLKDKTREVKDIIDRAANNLVKKLTRTPEEEEKERKKRSSKKGKNCKMPIESTTIMLKWLLLNFNDPYPQNAEKAQMAKKSGLAVDQVNNWFINARERVIKKFIKSNRDYQRPIFQEQSD